MNSHYQTICQTLVKDLTPRTKEILMRRFGLRGADPETLESIGEKYGITRERIRQIEEYGLKQMRERAREKLPGVFQDFTRYFKANNSLKREDILLSRFGGLKFKNHVFFC